MAPTSERSRGPWRRAWRFLYAWGSRFSLDRGLLHASALTYATLLSLVPLLALMFAVLKGLGAQGRLERWLLARGGLGPQVTDRIVGFVDQINAGTLTTLGVVALVFTATSLLGNVEASLNHIWRERVGRPWWRKLSDYMSVLLLSPFLLLAGFGATSFLAEQQTIRGLLENKVIGEAWAQALRILPYVFNVMAFCVFYVVMPNRRPNFRAVFIGAAVAGVSWQIVQIGYVYLQIGVARANIVYGALAQLPVTLVWIYVSWTIILLGAELAALVEFGVDADEAEREGATPPRWGLGIEVLLRAGRCFTDAGGGIDLRQVARETHVALSLLETTVDALEEEGLLVSVEGKSSAFVLARDPATIDLGAISSLLEAAPAAASWTPAVAEILDQNLQARHDRLARLTLADLLAAQPSEPGRGSTVPGEDPPAE